MTMLTEDFEIAPRFTEWMRYPLPPETPRPRDDFNGWGWYKLPAPLTGLASAFPRATTIAKVLDDEYNLSRWARRETALRIKALAQMPPDTQLIEHFDTTAADALSAIEQALETGKVTKLDAVLDTVDNLMGGAAARELGECVHAWLEALHMGIVLMRDVPDLVRPHVIHARKVLAHRGLVVLSEYCERTVMNDLGEETVCGKLDAIGKSITTGELILLDIKTSKLDNLQYSWLSFGVQVGGCYGWATKMLGLDGKTWEPMPDIRKDFAVVLHVPSDQPERASAITIDMWWGGEVMAESLATRRRRKEAKVEVPKHALPVPSKAALRYVAARQALSDITSLDEGQAVYEAYEDVWDDDLGEFAATVAELL